MTSWIGRSIAHYRVTAQIGAGGMGEVYRASDSRLGRDVAIKVLPAEFAQDAERMARFEREARLLASLSHANIASIFGIEEIDGSRALVMELVEGPTLADRLAKGALAAEEALPIAKQIADALEYAHERAIIHRDLKPANIKLTPDGTVKVLDFGLAKALSDDPTGSGSDLSKSPTLTAASTRLGVILGTAAYMSPEQAKGKVVDRRADIWAFGAVLYEVLTGQQAFVGETVSETLASVMKDEPDWNALPASTPARVRDLVRRCLVKDPRQRLRDIGDARIRIEEEVAGKPDSAGSAIGTAPVARRGLPAAALALIAVLAVALGIAGGYRLRAPAAPPLVRATLSFPEGMTLDEDDVPFALSPDGRVVAMAATARGETQRLWVRHLDTADALPIQGTEGASYPFWSPDGHTIGFFADRKLKRVPADGGVVQNICDAVDGRGATWGPDGTIVFSPGPLDGLNRVSANGGTPEGVTTLDSVGATHRLPVFLPGGKRVLFVHGASNFAKLASIECVDLATKKRVPVLECQSQMVCAGPDQVAYMLDGNLVMQRFDPSSLKVSGAAVPVAQEIQYNPYRYAGAFDVSASGTLVYTRRTANETSQPTWFDLDGKELGKLGDAAPIAMSVLAPRGDRLLTCDRTETFDLYMTDVATGVRNRFTFGPDLGAFPLWSPDEKSVYYGSGSGIVWVRSADGSTPAKNLFNKPEVSLWPDQISRDGAVIVCAIQRPQSGIDLCTIPVSGGNEFRELITAPGNQVSSSFSSDGRWLAYQSDESGRDEVVVVRFPTLAGRWQVSSNGGAAPKWLPDGSAILYTTPDRHLARVAVDTRGDGLVVGNTTRVFGGHTVDGPWMLSPDGRRLLVLIPQGGNATVSIDLVSDWRQLIKK